MVTSYIDAVGPALLATLKMWYESFDTNERFVYKLYCLQHNLGPEDEAFWALLYGAFTQGKSPMWQLEPGPTGHSDPPQPPR